MLCYPFKLYNVHLYLLCHWLLSPCPIVLSPPATPLFPASSLLSVSLLHPELHWTQRELKVWLGSVRSEVYWCPHRYQCISVWPCAVSSASISSAWVGHLWFSPLQTLPSQHSEKQQSVTAFHYSVHTQTSAHSFNAPKCIYTLKSHLNIYWFVWKVSRKYLVSLC